jgi:phosphopantetheinyl transferase (holo-ACP synthase)
MGYVIDTIPEALLERIEHHALPEQIISAYEPLRVETSGGDIDTSQSITGTLLIKKIASDFMEIPRIDLLTMRYEKPRAFIGSREVSVSFSHTRDALAAAVSDNFNVGLDMERMGRHVHERLSKRMKHSGEPEVLYRDNELIRIWTLKEAALKMIGTGLRKPMKSVCLEQDDESLFNVQFDDGKRAKICSFLHQDHWISICYRQNTITNNDR